MLRKSGTPLSHVQHEEHRHLTSNTSSTAISRPTRGTPLSHVGQEVNKRNTTTSKNTRCLRLSPASYTRVASSRLSHGHCRLSVALAGFPGRFHLCRSFLVLEFGPWVWTLGLDPGFGPWVWSSDVLGCLRGPTFQREATKTSAETRNAGAMCWATGEQRNYQRLRKLTHAGVSRGLDFELNDWKSTRRLTETRHPFCCSTP